MELLKQFFCLFSVPSIFSDYCLIAILFFEKTYPVARRPQWNPDLYTLSDSSLQFQKILPFPALPPSVSPAWSAFFCRNMLPVLVQNPQEQILCIAIPFQIPQKENVWYFHKCLSKYPTDGSPLFFRKYFFSVMIPCYFSVSFPFLFKFRKASPVRRISSKIFRTCFIIVHLKSSHVRSTYTGSPIPPGSSPDDEVPQSEGL